MTTWLRRHWLILTILFAALLLRLPLLAGSFWLDEAAQALESARPLREQLLITDDFQPPLLHLLTYVSVHIFTSEWWLRLWGALIPGLLTIWGTYLLGTRFHSRRAGLLAATLLATSSFHIFYSQELRPYSLSALWAIWSWYFLLVSLAPQHRRAIFTRPFYGFLLTTIAGIYSTYLYPFVYFSQLVYLALKRRWTHLSYSLTITILAFLPWLPSFLDQLHAGQTLRLIFPGWETIVSFTFIRSLLLTVAKFLYGVLDVEVNFPFVAVTCLLAGLLILLCWRRRRDFRATHSVWLALAIMFTIPFVTASLISIFVPVVQPKRVIFLLPIFYLALGFLISRSVHSRRDALPARTLFAVLLVVNLFGTISYYTQPALQRENWRQLIATLHQDWSTRDTLAVFVYPGPFSPWTWYEQTASDPFPTLSTGNYDTSTLTDLDTRLQPLLSYDHVIIFDYLRDLTDRDGRLLQYLSAHDFVAGEIYTYANLGQVRVFHQVSTTDLAKLPATTTSHSALSLAANQ